MDIPLSHPEKRTIFKKFEYLDLIPYSIAATMLVGCVYIALHIMLFARI